MKVLIVDDSNYDCEVIESFIDEYLKIHKDVDLMVSTVNSGVAAIEFNKLSD